MERNSRMIIKRLEKQGWKLDRVKGGHHIFKHPEKPDPISLTHPRKDVSPGLVRSIYKTAGWR
ncbi:MAG: type II toxin-antitoxin system HicA family toxin [Proteobacteria bacterium]|nr:type II toxin-antitoxin system HicA family toxin [Pseudomonadota bacterium]